MSETLDLLDWKRRIFALYAEIRADPQPERAWRHWRDVRDAMFRHHPQSPKPGHASLAYYDYEPSLRFAAEVVPAEPEARQIGDAGFTRFATASFAGRELELYWLDAYGGGLFLPFRDATSGSETYGAGRYLLDSVKGADLGTVDGRLVLDFNFAYQPSCSYDPRWACPLSPPANTLGEPVRAGERSSSPA